MHFFSLFGAAAAAAAAAAMMPRLKTKVEAEMDIQLEP